jgi:hypothetical protein
MHGAVYKCIKDISRKHWKDRQVERQRCRWKYNTKMDLKEIWWGGCVDCIKNVAKWLTLVNTAIKDGKFLE